MTFDEIFPNIIPNRDETVRRFSGNTALLEKFVRKFPQDENWLKLKATANDDNWAEMEMTAHTLKGYAGNIGFTKLFEVTADLVKAIRDKNFDHAKELIPQVITVGTEIESYINQLD